MGSLYSCSLSLYIPMLLRRVFKGYWSLLVCRAVYVSKVVRCRSVQSSCLHYMPRGVSSSLDYMHVALSYYIGTGTLYQKPEFWISRKHFFKFQFYFSAIADFILWFCTSLSSETLTVSPLVDLKLISEKSIWKNQVPRIGFVVYFELNFYFAA